MKDSRIAKPSRKKSKDPSGRRTESSKETIAAVSNIPTPPAPDQRWEAAVPTLYTSVDAGVDEVQIIDPQPPTPGKPSVKRRYHREASPSYEELPRAQKQAMLWFFKKDVLNPGLAEFHNVAMASVQQPLDAAISAGITTEHSALVHRQLQLVTLEYQKQMFSDMQKFVQQEMSRVLDPRLDKAVAAHHEKDRKKRREEAVKRKQREEATAKATADRAAKVLKAEAATPDRAAAATKAHSKEDTVEKVSADASAAQSIQNAATKSQDVVPDNDALVLHLTDEEASLCSPRSVDRIADEDSGPPAAAKQPEKEKGRVRPSGEQANQPRETPGRTITPVTPPTDAASPGSSSLTSSSASISDRELVSFHDDFMAMTRLCIRVVKAAEPLLTSVFGPAQFIQQTRHAKLTYSSLTLLLSNRDNAMNGYDLTKFTCFQRWARDHPLDVGRLQSFFMGRGPLPTRDRPVRHDPLKRGEGGMKRRLKAVITTANVRKCDLTLEVGGDESFQADLRMLKLPGSQRLYTDLTASNNDDDNQRRSSDVRAEDAGARHRSRARGQKDGGRRRSRERRSPHRSSGPARGQKRGRSRSPARPSDRRRCSRDY